jgi:hypothetical protein
MSNSESIARQATQVARAMVQARRSERLDAAMMAAAADAVYTLAELIEDCAGASVPIPVEDTSAKGRPETKARKRVVSTLLRDLTYSRVWDSVCALVREKVCMGCVATREMRGAGRNRPLTACGRRDGPFRALWAPARLSGTV